LFMSVYRLSAKYGQYGLLKKAGARNIPQQITSNSRALFLSLQNQNQ
jgi:hypothetical protein